jgi:hypothetical protein
MSTTASERLREQLELAMPAVRASSERIWKSPSVHELYPVWLGAMHGIARATVPLMEAACARATELGPVDRVAARLAPYLRRHGPEVAGLDRWLLEDLAEADGLPDEVLQRTPSRRIAALAGAQYYWIRHQHPVGLLGHLAFVEGDPPEPGLSERLRAATGYPPAAFRSIRRRERLDVRHREELYEVIDSLPLEPEHETLLGVSALHSAYGTVEVLDEIRAAVPALQVLA